MNMLKASNSLVYHQPITWAWLNADLFLTGSLRSQKWIKIKIDGTKPLTHLILTYHC